MADGNGNQELSSEELLRRARAQFDNPAPAAHPANPDGPSIDDAAAAAASPSPPTPAPPVAPTSSVPPPPWSVAPATQPPAPQPASYQPPSHQPPSPEPALPQPPSPEPALQQPPALQPPQSPVLPPAPASSQKGWFTWRRALAVAVVALAVVGALTARSTTPANRIDVGDCFADPGGGSFITVDDQDCAEPHDVQVIAEVEVQLNPFASSGECERVLREIMRSDHMEDASIIVPNDAIVNELSPADQNVGLADVLCILESSSGGLVGSVLPE